MRSNVLPSKFILATENEKVDSWSTLIQTFNRNESRTLISKDSFSDVDDENGYLAAMLTTAAKRDFSNTQVPDHELVLKVGDICLLTRNLNSLNLASNSTFRIIRINTYSIIVKTMDESERLVTIPRIRFVFKLNMLHPLH
jgi:hypothetical protein